MTRFSHAIVKRPAQTISKGLTSANLGKPNYDNALRQHDSYIEALKKCNVDVTILDADDAYPDSCFVEDTALITPKCAIITNPGAPSRKGETKDIQNCLLTFFDHLEHINPPGTIEAGDIMMVENHYYIGLSERTNDEGANQMISILQNYGLNGSKVIMAEMLHLKTGLSYLENNHLVVAGEFDHHDEFKTFNKIKISKDEAYSANCIWVNEKVIVPEGFPNSHQEIINKGFETIPVDVSEFEKIDGGLSCLSLRF